MKDCKPCPKCEQEPYVISLHGHHREIQAQAKCQCFTVASYHASDEIAEEMVVAQWNKEIARKTYEEKAQKAQNPKMAMPEV